VPVPAPAAVAVPYRPAGQKAHLVAPAPTAAPAAPAAGAFDEKALLLLPSPLPPPAAARRPARRMAATVVGNLPAGHRAQDVPPSKLLCLPGGHGTQGRGGAPPPPPPPA
jgi:hypothetical protein